MDMETLLNCRLEIDTSYTIAPGMAARGFLPRCIALYDRTPIDSLTIPYSNAVHFGGGFLAAVSGVLIYYT